MPPEFFWNDEVYATIDQWRVDTGLDVGSLFLIGPLQSGPHPRVHTIPAALDALKWEKNLRPEMFHALHRLDKDLD